MQLIGDNMPAMLKKNIGGDRPRRPSPGRPRCDRRRNLLSELVRRARPCSPCDGGARLLPALYDHRGINLSDNSGGKTLGAERGQPSLSGARVAPFAFCVDIRSLPHTLRGGSTGARTWRSFCVFSFSLLPRFSSADVRRSCRARGP